MASNIEHRNGRPGNRWRMAIWGGAACLLLLPLVAMQFTDEVNWDAADFAVMGVMLVAACGAYELATRMSDSMAYRAGAGIAIVSAFLLVWVNLAVGIIGTEGNVANLMFLGVLAVGAIGALLARFRARGMARALVAMAVTQVLVATIAVVASWGMPYSPPVEIIGITVLFATPWLVSAALFRKAAGLQALGG